MDQKPLRNNRPKGPSGNNRKGMKNAGFIALIVLALLVVYAATSQPANLKKVPITTAVSQANAGQYSKISVSGNQLTITKKGDNHPTLKSYLEPNATLRDEGFNYAKVEID